MPKMVDAGIFIKVTIKNVEPVFPDALSAADTAVHISATKNGFDRSVSR